MIESSAIRLLVIGAQGKMGARIVDLARQSKTFSVIAAFDQHNIDDANSLDDGSIDGVIDFSSDAGARRAVEIAGRHRAALVIGTTGLSADSLDIIEVSARSIPVILAPNMSLGAAVLTHLATRAAQLLGDEFHVDLIESHHVAKRDAPSGTARRIIEQLRAIQGVDLPDDRVHVIRAGDIIGEHTVEFSGPGERIRLAHLATNRDLFALGALRAARWLVGKPPGRYSIDQTLGLDKM